MGGKRLGINIGFYRQRKGDKQDGPLGPSLKAMAELDKAGRPISPVGKEIADMIRARGVRVIFFPTGGDGATPWTGLVIYDVTYKGEGQVTSPGLIGLVAHELTHILQRDRADPRYWPSGLLRFNPFTRWFGDSTNYMEILAYIIGWTVEYDLIQHRLTSSRETKETRDQLRSKLKTIEKYLATFTGPDIQNAKRFIVKKYTSNAFYRQNYRKEKSEVDGRVPRGGWEYWLRQLQFSEHVIKHVRSIAKKGKIVPVNSEEVDELVKTKMVCDEIVQQEFVSTNNLKKIDRAKLLTRLNVHIGGTALLVLLYMLIHKFWPSNSTEQNNWAVLARTAWNWIWWIGVGVAVRGLSSIVRSPNNTQKSERIYIIRWKSVLFVGIFITVLGVLFIASRMQLNLDLDVAFARTDSNLVADGVLTSVAWSFGFFHQLVTNFFRTIACIFWEGVVVPIFALLGRGKEV